MSNHFQNKILKKIDVKNIKMKPPVALIKKRVGNCICL